MEPFRIEPALPVGAVQTYSVAAPLATHWRDAICEEADCPNWRNGWKTLVNESTDLGRRQAHYIRSQSGRRFTTHREGAAVVFTFEAEQRCFATHKVPLERDPLYLVRMGDWRGFQGGRIHKRPGEWVEDFATHQQRVADRVRRG